MSSNKFDWKYYIERYDDLKLLGINNKKLAIQHYKNYGKNENRFRNRITEAKYYKLNDIDKNKDKSFLQNISDQLNTEENTSSLHSVSEINSESNICNNKIYSEILYLKNDIKSIKQELNKLFNLINKKYNIENNNLFIKSIGKGTKSNKIISSEEYEVCNNLSDSYNNELNTINYSNEIEHNNINSNDINIDDISYDK